jgi:MFS family permease
MKYRVSNISANIIGLSFGNVIGELYFISKLELEFNESFLVLGWSSPTIAKIQENSADSPLNFIPTTSQLSWIGSLLSIGGFFAIFFANFPEWIGRKWSLLLNALLFIASFLILIFTNNIAAIYIARFIQGFAAGVCNVILPMYIGEIASPECRWEIKQQIQ